MSAKLLPISKGSSGGIEWVIVGQLGTFLSIGVAVS